MHLQFLELENFRNYSQQSFEFGDEVQVIFGDNAQGKTNLIESIYMMAVLRGFRGLGGKDLIQQGALSATIRGQVISDLGDDQLGVHITPGGRKIVRNGKAPESVASYLSVLPVVRFIPDDLLILKGSGGPRRRMLDRSIFHLVTSHLSALQDYNRILSQKNHLLRSRTGDSGQLEVWNQRLANQNGQVVAARLAYLDEINPRVQEFFGQISASTRVARVEYSTELGEDSSLPRDSKALAELSMKTMVEKEREEWGRGHAVVGAHRDDFVMLLDGGSLKRYGSQGQHRMFALALKVAEIVLQKSRTQQYPVLLLDDVRSELDQDRVRYLFSFLNRIPAQIFVSSTDFRELSAELDRPTKHWKVHNGRAEVVATRSRAKAG